MGRVEEAGQYRRRTSALGGRVVTVEGVAKVVIDDNKTVTPIRCKLVRKLRQFIMSIRTLVQNSEDSSRK